jgi:hypothetical protein
MSHQRCLQDPTRHAFSCDGDDGRVSQDLPDWFLHQFPNSAHDQYRHLAQIFGNQGIGTFYLELEENQPILVAEDRFLAQNLKDFL